MGVTMALQMRMQPKPNDPTQARVMQFMPYFLTMVLAKMPAGLVLYWTWSNTLSVIQQWVITRRYNTTHPDPPREMNIFDGDCRFVLSAPEPGALPQGRYPEVAFAGRSNVGKSSLINALTGQQKVWRGPRKHRAARRRSTSSCRPKS